jgi:hypothetical protein
VSAFALASPRLVFGLHSGVVELARIFIQPSETPAPHTTPTNQIWPASANGRVAR